MVSTFNKSEWLLNDCQSEKIAKCSAAVSAHEVTWGTSMYHADDSHLFIELASEYVDRVEGQEILQVSMFTNFDDASAETIAIFYEKEDLVLLCCDFTAEEDEESFIEPMHAMTTAGFFNYLNALPNVHKFSIPSTLDEKTQVGLELLQELAQA